MKRKSIALIIVYLSFLSNIVLSAENDLRVLPEKIDGVETRDMMKNYLIKQVRSAHQRWKNEYELLKTPQQIATYQERYRDYFLDVIGDFPQRTPLNPQITGTLQRDGYRVEKIIFESQPRHYVTGAAFIPQAEKF